MAERAPWFSYLHYPAVMTFTFSLFALMRSQGVPLVLSTYVPVLVAAGIVTALEMKFPYRSEWRPPADEVKTDLGFMTIVQLAFPPLVGFLFTYALIAPARALNLPLAQVWPHAWPVWLQAVLMILVVDLLRYWLHRAAHENDTLWRLHSVHHSVQQLYWLNTARFHFIEKTMQMMLDSLPFLLRPSIRPSCRCTTSLMRRTGSSSTATSTSATASSITSSAARRRIGGTTPGFRANRTPTTETR